MALPKLNATPSYEMEIPSTGKKVRFRPYLVKEEKILLMASETKDTKAILNAVVATIKDCVEDPGINFSKLSTFDIEYMFTKIRSKSVGEVVKVRAKCKNKKDDGETCDYLQEVEIDLDKIKIDVPKNNKIKLNDEIVVELNWPSYTNVINNELDKMEKKPELVFNMIQDCIEAVVYKEERILAKDQSKEEIEQFVESFTSGQFQKIASFFNDIPQMKQEISFVCDKCKGENNVVLRGMSDFF